MQTLALLALAASGARANQGEEGRLGEKVETLSLGVCDQRLP